MRTAWYALGLVALFVTPLAAAEGSQTYEHTYGFEVTGISTPTSHTSTGTNCLILAGPTELQSLRATATWAAQSPLTERLELVLVGFGADGRFEERLTGPSPLTLHVAALHLADGEDAWLAVQTDGLAVAVEQAVDLHVVIEHDTEGDFAPATAGCAIG